MAGSTLHYSLFYGGNNKVLENVDNEELENPESSSFGEDDPIAKAFEALGDIRDDSESDGEVLDEEGNTGKKRVVKYGPRG